MTKSCLVCSCIYKKEGSRSFHSLPRNIALRKKWFEVLQITDQTLSIYNYVCSDHFKLEDIYVSPIGKKFLRKGSIPSIFAKRPVSAALYQRYNMFCSVSSCKNIKRLLPPNSGITFHRFPRDEVRFQQWLEAIGNINSNIKWTDSTFICSEHFQEDDYQTTTNLHILKNTAIPSLNLSRIITPSPTITHVSRNLIFKVAPVHSSTTDTTSELLPNKLLHFKPSTTYTPVSPSILTSSIDTESETSSRKGELREMRQVSGLLYAGFAHVMPYNGIKYARVTTDRVSDSIKKIISDTDSSTLIKGRHLGVEYSYLPVNTNTNESEKENVVTDENSKKLNLSSDFSENSINNSKLVENLYELPTVEIYVKSDSEEDNSIVPEHVEEHTIEVPDANEISPAVGHYRNSENEDEVNVPTEDPLEEEVEYLSDSSTLTALSENGLEEENISEGEETAGISSPVPIIPETPLPCEEDLTKRVEYLSDSSTLTALSENELEEENLSDGEETASISSPVLNIPEAPIPCEEDLTKRKVLRYFGDCSIDDLYNPNRAQRSWQIAKRTIAQQKAKILRIQVQNRRLRSRIENLNSLLSYIFHNYEFQKRG